MCMDKIVDQPEELTAMTVEHLIRDAGAGLLLLEKE